MTCDMTVLAYIDDFTIYSKSFDDYCEHLERVLARISKLGLKLKASKVEFLGHEISSEGIAPNKKKVEAIEKFPVPQSLKAVRSFLGVTSYYRRFIQDYATIAESLIMLT